MNENQANDKKDADTASDAMNVGLSVDGISHLSPREARQLKRCVKCRELIIPANYEDEFRNICESCFYEGCHLF